MKFMFRDARDLMSLCLMKLYGIKERTTFHLL